MAALIRQIHRLARQNVAINLLGSRSMSSDNKLSSKPPASALEKGDNTVLAHQVTDDEVPVNAERLYEVNYRDDADTTEEELKEREEYNIKTLFKQALGEVAGDHRIQLKEELMGTLDPFDVGVIQQDEDVGVEDNPILVPLVDDTRVIGCVCEDDNSEVVWMMVHSGEKKTCDCGNWFMGVPIPGAHAH